MAGSPYGSIFAKLAERQIVVPYIETAVMSEDWPDSYTVVVDSSPYYGGVAPDGDTSIHKEIKRGGSGDGYFHPSTHGLMPERLLYYHFHPFHHSRLIRDKWNLQSIMTVTMGTAMHAIIQTQLQMMGMLTQAGTEVEFIGERAQVRGRLDTILEHPTYGRLPMEFKTQNPRAYEAQKVIKDMWDAQFSICLDQLGFDWGVLLVLQTGWPFNFKEFRVDKNQRLVDEIYAKWDRVRAAIAADIPPQRCCSLNSGTMKSCPARFECWGELK